MRIAFHTACLPEFVEAWAGFQPLGFGYLSAFLRRLDPNLEIVLARTEDELVASRADVVGLTAVTYNYGQARLVARKVKNQCGAVVALGGPHVTALPERMDAEFDYGVLGEGEQTFADLIERLKQGNPPGALETIEGLVFWRGGARVINRPRQLITPLDTLPFPERELFGVETLRGGTVTAISSRGCPYDCFFCATAKHWQRLRTHSAEYLVQEIGEIIERYRPRLIHYEDDLFIADRKRLTDVAEAILRLGYHKRVEFHVSGRADLLTDEVCEILRSINTRTVFVGFESNSDKVLKALGKRNVTAEINQRAADNVVRHGMKLVGAFILGAPGETRDDAYETHRFIHRNLDAFTHMYAGVLRLLPGTEFWRQAMERGLIDENLAGIVLDSRDADGWFSLSERYPMLCDTMTRGELMALFMAFVELSRYIDERECGKRLQSELESLRSRNIDGLGIRATARALMGKVGQRLKGES